MSLTATLGVELACVLLVMCGLAPDADRIGMVRAGNVCSERAGPAWPGYDHGTPRRPTIRSPDHDRPHEDTAQRSAYEVKHVGSIDPGYNWDSDWRLGRYTSAPSHPRWLGERSELPGGTGGRPPGEGLHASLTRWPGLAARCCT